MKAWKDYIVPPDGEFDVQRNTGKVGLLGQRKNITKLYDVTRPKSVLCMGSGYLNDIPIADFIAGGSEVYFADWMIDITEESFRHDIVTRLEEKISCVVCQYSKNPQQYCKSYEEFSNELVEPKETNDVCKNFNFAPNNNPLCDNYVPGEFPKFCCGDVTQGRAKIFAESIPEYFSKNKIIKSVLQQAIRNAKKDKDKEILNIEDNSMDLITSSMVVSQFDREPYVFFIENILQRFTQKQITKEMKTLDKMKRRLKEILYLDQLEGHCQEIIRLLKPDGRVYFSLGLMYHDRECTGEYTKSDASIKIMDVIEQYFTYDYETLPEIFTTENFKKSSIGTHQYKIKSYLFKVRSQSSN